MTLITGNKAIWKKFVISPAVDKSAETNKLNKIEISLRLNLIELILTEHLMNSQQVNISLWIKLISSIT